MSPEAVKSHLISNRTPRQDSIAGFFHFCVLELVFFEGLVYLTSLWGIRRIRLLGVKGQISNDRESLLAVKVALPFSVLLYIKVCIKFNFMFRK